MPRPRIATPDCAEFILGHAEGVTRGLRPGYGSFSRHCEERRDEAIHASACRVDCFASLAMTAALHPGYGARIQADIALAESTWLRSRNFWILPVEVLGIVPNITAFGVLKPDM